ncbi:hypothetical protein [Actinoplanes sp. NPDC026619]|uniref:hypothetical protein n=1 Tax=Actinoplanes sp. NPDC026619 TaxID=3155798 RepID=UPI00340F74D9
MVAFVAAAFPGQPAVFERAALSDHVPDAEYPGEPAQYRSRQRVAYILPGDGDDPAPQRWSGSGPNMYETDWSTHRHRRGRRRRPGRTVFVVVAMGAVAAVAGGVIAFGGAAKPTAEPVAIDAALQRETRAATRSEVRLAPTPAKSSASPTRSPKASSSPRPPKPVTGLNQAQMNNAAVIVQVGQKRGVPRRAMLVAMMTGLQESSLRNLANTTVPDSLDEPNEGSGENFDSLGVFQQRPSQGWGSVEQLMSPRYAADAFYERLLKVAGWETRPLGEAAQAVQRSAVPDAYAVHEDRATEVLDALL